MRLLLILVAIPILSSLAFAEEQVLLDESFSKDAIPKTWQSGGRKNSFSIVDNTLRGIATAGDHHGPSIGLPIKCHNLVLEFDYKFVKPGYLLCLIDGESQFAGQAHLLRLAVTKTHIQIAQDRGDLISKRKQKKERDKNGGKRIPPTKAQLADDSFYRVESLARKKSKTEDGDWHHVSIKMQGNKVVAMIDNKKLLATGTVFDVKKSRLVFLVAQTGDIRIDNVKLKSISKP